MDKTMAGWYWENDRRLSEARAYVAEVLNCEDILMNCKTRTDQGHAAGDSVDAHIIFQTSLRGGLVFHLSWLTYQVKLSRSIPL